ncbi:hypothetical protein [Alkalicoccus urumqiensis]|uniref:Uncharacterized protein n=1 Tax=Alkalicoccus urumqiensis TaxID=1548213 RepID=A0A2P6MFK3_ALKUR|nr:hypothetical protein [Alkalicoccus urumqiensis]PRO65020.1 hypothetical protein C6I21_11260 [Alkalicoccus urumqiensis]
MDILYITAPLLFAGAVVLLVLKRLSCLQTAGRLPPDAGKWLPLFLSAGASLGASAALFTPLSIPTALSIGITFGYAAAYIRFFLPQTVKKDAR